MISGFMARLVFWQGETRAIGGPGDAVPQIPGRLNKTSPCFNRNDISHKDISDAIPRPGRGDLRGARLDAVARKWKNKLSVVPR